MGQIAGQIRSREGKHRPRATPSISQFAPGAQSVYFRNPSANVNAHNLLTIVRRSCHTEPKVGNTVNAALQPALAILKRSIKDVAFIGSVLPTQIDLKSPRADI